MENEGIFVKRMDELFDRYEDILTDFFDSSEWQLHPKEREILEKLPALIGEEAPPQLRVFISEDGRLPVAVLFTSDTPHPAWVIEDEWIIEEKWKEPHLEIPKESDTDEETGPSLPVTADLPPAWEDLIGGDTNIFRKTVAKIIKLVTGHDPRHAITTIAHGDNMTIETDSDEFPTIEYKITRYAPSGKQYYTIHHTDVVDFYGGKFGYGSFPLCGKYFSNARRPRFLAKILIHVIRVLGGWKHYTYFPRRMYVDIVKNEEKRKRR